MLVRLVNFEKCHSPLHHVAQPDWDRVPHPHMVFVWGNIAYSVIAVIWDQ
jgi:hypothetical protein